MTAIPPAPTAVPDLTALPDHLREPLGPLAEAVLPQLRTIVAPNGRLEPCRDLLKPDRLAEILDTYGRRWPEGDRRAVASDWSKGYLRVLVPVVILPALCGLAVAGGADDLAMAVDDRACPAGLAARPVAGAGAVPAGPMTACDRLIDAHLAPLAWAVAEASGLAPRVVWSNAGNLIAFLLREARHSPALGDSAAGLEARMLAPRLRHGARNPLFQPVRLEAVPLAPNDGSRTMAVRRICCLRDSLGEALCTSCPRLPPEERAALARRLRAAG